MAEEQVRVEAIFELQNDAKKTFDTMTSGMKRSLDAIEHMQKEAKKGILGSLDNVAGVFAGGFIGSTALGAIGEIKDKLIEAALAAEDLRDKTTATVWLLTSQGLTSGPRRFAEAADIGAAKVDQFRQWAREGIGEVDKYAEAWSRLTPFVLRAGGGIEDADRMTKALVPLTRLYGDQAFEAVTKLLSGAKRLPDPMIALLGTTKEEIRELKRVEEAFGLVKRAMPSMEEIGSDVAMGIDSQIAKGNMAAAEAWRQAGEVWAPILVNAQTELAKLVTAAAHPLDSSAAYLAQGGADIAYFMGWDSMGDSIMRFKWRLDDSRGAATDMTGKLKATGAGVGELGDEAVGAAGAINALADAAKSTMDAFRSQMRATESAFVSRPNLTPEEVLLRASQWASSAGIGNNTLAQFPEVEGALADLVRATADGAHQDFRTLQDALAFDSEAVRGVAAETLKVIGRAVSPDMMKALADKLSGTRSNIPKPTVRVDKVEIKVDARHQDPDRVAIAVQDALGRAAMRPTRARSGLPFGT